MNDIEKIKERATFVFENAALDGYSLHFEAGDFVGRNDLSAKKIYLNLGSCFENHKVSQVSDLYDFTELIVAHELGHAIYEESVQKIGTALQFVHRFMTEENYMLAESFYDVYNDHILESERIAWENARSFLVHDIPESEIINEIERHLVFYGINSRT